MVKLKTNIRYIGFREVICKAIQKISQDVSDERAYSNKSFLSDTYENVGEKLSKNGKNASVLIFPLFSKIFEIFVEILMLQ